MHEMRKEVLENRLLQIEASLRDVQKDIVKLENKKDRLTQRISIVRKAIGVLDASAEKAERFKRINQDIEQRKQKQLEFVVKRSRQ